MSLNIDVCVVIGDYHNLRGGGGGALIKELHNSNVRCACNDCKVPQFAEQPDSNVAPIHTHNEY